MTDAKALGAIAARIVRIQSGLMGDVKSVGDKVSEIRVDVGPGYRIYFTRRGLEIVLLLCGGDKSTQQADIARAKVMVRELDRARSVPERPDTRRGKSKK